MGFFSKLRREKKWEDLPQNYCAEIKKYIGSDGWEWLVDLTQRYKLLNQAFFSEPEVFADTPEERMIPLALFLNSGGNHLAMQQKFVDAEKTLLISLRLFPDESNSAHASIAMVYHIQGNSQKAKTHATIALRDLEENKLFQTMDQSGANQQKQTLREIIEK